MAAATKDDKDARRWKRELAAAKKRDKDWLAEANKVVKRYRGEERKKSRWNVLWTNTRILRPVIYNSRPNPDVRRRFRDADPLGKAVSELLERSLSVFIDHDETDTSIKNDVLDSLLVGRGISRIRYEPTITQAPKETDEDDDSQTADGSAPEEPEDDATDEQLDGERVICEHVDWRDYREGYGRVWAEVPWVAYRHKLTRTDAEATFDKTKLKDIEFTMPQEDDAKKQGENEEEKGDPAKVAEFWEIWDKIGGKVFFFHEDVKELLYPKETPNGEPPFKLEGFFPSPDPVNVMADTGSRLPIPMFRMYEEQADELDKITGRIDRIVNALRLRGVYDATLPEMSELLSSDDNEMVPIANAGRWDKTGLDGAISWMPVEKAVEVLQALVEARKQQLEAIDQILGISDIVRGATDPNETLGAQQMKGGYFSARLYDMKDTVQRYVRDVLRIATSIMAQKFEQKTFADMTDMNFPTNQAKQQLVAKLNQQAQMAQAMAQMHTPQPQPGPPGPPQASPGTMPANAPVPGAPPGAGAGMVPPHPAPGAPQAPAPAGPPAQGVPHPPMPPPGPSPQQQAMLKMPSWEDVMGIMRSNRIRQYKVDVETDSMVQGTLSSDMAGLAEVLGAVTKTLTELAPLITSGALPVDAAKEIVMTVVRRARMGLAVEDALDKMQAPKPPPDPNAGKAQAAIAAVQAKGQVDAENAKVKAQADIQVAQIKAQLEAHVAQVQQQAQAQQNQQEQFLEQQRTQQQAQNDAWQTKLDAAVKIIVAQIAAKTAVDTATISAANQEATADL